VRDQEQRDERIHPAAGQPDGESRLGEVNLRADLCDGNAEQHEQRSGIAYRERLEMVAQYIQELCGQRDGEAEVRNREEQRTRQRSTLKVQDQPAQREQERHGHEEGEDGDEAGNNTNENPMRVVWVGEPGMDEPVEGADVEEREDEQDKKRDLWDLHSVPPRGLGTYPRLFLKDIASRSSVQGRFSLRVVENPLGTFVTSRQETGDNQIAKEKP
jgi:hypothetical protein